MSAIYVQKLAQSSLDAFQGPADVAACRVIVGNFDNRAVVVVAMNAVLCLEVCPFLWELLVELLAAIDSRCGTSRMVGSGIIA